MFSIITKWDEDFKVTKQVSGFSRKSEAEEYIAKYNLKKMYPDCFIVRSIKAMPDTWYIDLENGKLISKNEPTLDDLRNERNMRLDAGVAVTVNGDKVEFGTTAEDMQRWFEVIAYATTASDSTKIRIQAEDAYIIVTPETALKTMHQILEHRQKIFNAYFKMKKDIPSDYTKDKYWK